MKRKLLFFTIFTFVFLSRVYSQLPDVNVSMLTGSPSINVPIYTMTKGQITVNVSLAYQTTGPRPLDIEGSAGMGWNLVAGGQVVRTVKGLPDDLIDNVHSPVLNGWMTSTGPASIASFTIANTGTSPSCTAQTSDINYINASLPYNQDTEPDDFFVNAPGLSCHLVYDRTSGKFKPVSYQDLLITYTTTGGTGVEASLINSFTITNDKGTKYVFEAPESVYEYISASATPQVLTTHYSQYINGVKYNQTWSLTKVLDPSGAGILFNYTLQPARKSTDAVNLYLNGSTTVTNIYNIKKTTGQQRLTSMTTTDITSDAHPGLFFNWRDLTASFVESGGCILTGINGMGLDISCSYDAYQYTSSTGLTWKQYLTRIDGDTKNSTLSKVSYNFDYVPNPGFTSLMPDSTTKEIDYWGYYVHNSNTTLLPKVRINPSDNSLPRYTNYTGSNASASYTFTTTNGADRSAATTNFAVGSLQKITNEQSGATTTIVYEPNSFVDVPSNQVMSGGGIRVKQVTEYDGINTANNMVRNYSYSATVGGITSGRPLSMPVFAFTAPYTGTATGQTYWNTATVLSETDLSDDDHSIYYEYVRLTKPGAGSTLFQNYIPGKYWDQSASPVCSSCAVEWYPTINNIARIGCTTAMWGVKNDIYSYPFIPNPNYDFEQGLPKKVTFYDESNTVVRETSYSYQRYSTPSVITAFRADKNFSTAIAYNKYPVYFNAGELTTQIIDKAYNAATPQVTTTNLTYASANHRLLTKKSVVNSDNSINNTYFSYAKDFPTNSTNNNVKALYNLGLMNINCPVETYQQVVRSGATVTTGGGLTLFTPFTTGSTTIYPAVTQLKFVSPVGLSSFTPFASTSGSPVYNSAYRAFENYGFYDVNGMPQTITNAQRKVKTTLMNHLFSKPVATFDNAAFNEIGFSDFDTDVDYTPTYQFAVSPGAVISLNGHTGLCLNLTTETVSKTITRNAFTSNYYLSQWINPASGVTGNLTVKLNGTVAATIPFTGTGNWQYIEKKLSLSAQPSSVTISETTSQPLLLDDIIFYPDIAEVATVSYDLNGYQNSATNTNGISAYNANDQYGRVTYKYDQDRNIIQKNTYFRSGSGNSSYISVVGAGENSEPVVSYPTSFNTGDFDTNGTISWNFGDNVTANTTTGITVLHTYAAVGDYNVTAVVNSPYFGISTLTAAVHVTVKTTPLIPVNYTNTTTGEADITQMTFTSTVNGGPSYSFTNSQLISGAQVQQGSYNITVTLSGAKHNTLPGGPGYNSVTLNTACSDWVSTNVYSFSRDFSTASSVNISVSPSACSNPD